MVHRLIGQEELDLVAIVKARSSLHDLHQLLDWAPIAQPAEPCPRERCQRCSSSLLMPRVQKMPQLMAQRIAPALPA